MSSDIAIKIENLSKCYQIYEKPGDRLKQFLLPKFIKLMGGRPKNYYREFWALKDMSLEIKKGETVGIIGRNGSGKSTLLQLICGTLNPTSGVISTNGRVAALLELGSGFNPEFTGRENVYLNGVVLGLTKKEIDTKFDSIAAFADIGQFIDQPVKAYSSGMLVRLAFGVAINIDPEILIIDEALAVGDELFQRKCFARIEAIRANGATILFVSHSGSQIIELCNRAILLDGGEKIAVGAPKKIVSIYQKFLYAPSAKKKEIREQASADMLETDNQLAATCTIYETSEFATGEQSELFDPNLIPPSSIDFESHGPIIKQPMILTLSGQQVNNLVRGKKYRYCYQVVFHTKATTVRFGMSIKTTTGFTLAGALSAPNMTSAIVEIDKGASVDVEFTFDAHLNPGVYFLNAGVFGMKDGNEIVLHRKVDVLAFRILPISNNLETETVSFGFCPLVNINA
jgi:lipopolysaccharide transport system ATP-binding protein